MNVEEGGFLGVGWAFPVYVDVARGGIALSREVADIEESIRIIIGTAKGERRMRPEFGCSLHDLVFAPNNAATSSLASHYVQEALGQWEPRIEVLEVRAEADPKDPTRLLINVLYRIRTTNETWYIHFIVFLERGDEYDVTSAQLGRPQVPGHCGRSQALQLNHLYHVGW